jgi:DNA-binding MarR family transcriptional regulator
MTNQRARTVAALEEVIDETRLLFHRLKRTAEVLHRQGDFTAGRRGVLRSLYQSGPQSVPQLARARPVSRQHIQVLVNPLAVEGYVELVDNPAHKRSKLACLTTEGRALVETMLQRESELLGIIADDLVAGELASAASELRKLREVLERQTILDAAERIAE